MNDALGVRRSETSRDLKRVIERTALGQCAMVQLLP